MALSFSIELTPAESSELLRVARAAIDQGARDGNEAMPGPRPEGVFARPAATFVTLTQGGKLRGCMGSLEASEALVHSIAKNAFNAAMRDPRFMPLMPAETALTHIDIAVLSPLEPLLADSKDALLAALRPGEDGLLIDDGVRRATFLPKVWEQLPEPRDFIAHLMNKAGMPPGQWSPAMRCHRYTAQTFSEPEPVARVF